MGQLLAQLQFLNSKQKYFRVKTQLYDLNHIVIILLFRFGKLGKNYVCSREFCLFIPMFTCYLRGNKANLGLTRGRWMSSIPVLLLFNHHAGVIIIIIMNKEIPSKFRSMAEYSPTFTLHSPTFFINSQTNYLLSKINMGQIGINQLFLPNQFFWRVQRGFFLPNRLASLDMLLNLVID